MFNRKYSYWLVQSISKDSSRDPVKDLSGPLEFKTRTPLTVGAIIRVNRSLTERKAVDARYFHVTDIAFQTNPIRPGLIREYAPPTVYVRPCDGPSPFRF